MRPDAPRITRARARCRKLQPGALVLGPAVSHAVELVAAVNADTFPTRFGECRQRRPPPALGQGGDQWVRVGGSVPARLADTRLCIVRHALRSRERVAGSFSQTV